MRHALHFGAGNIGRGFLGQIYFESGWRTTFVDVSAQLVELLASRGEYRVRIVENELTQDILVSRFDAVPGSDLEQVADLVAGADLISTAVGVRALEGLAEPLARGLSRRLSRGAGPVDVLLAENMPHGAAFLRGVVRKLMLSELQDPMDRWVGFVDASIGRMVPVQDPRQDPLTVRVEAYCELPVDGSAFRAPVPELRHLMPKDDFDAWVERKLFVHNCGHSVAAYLGWLRGHDFIWQAMADPEVRPTVDQAMEEACLALSRCWGHPIGELREHAEDLKRRFQNRALGDAVERVGSDPVRKLGHEDRLFGAMARCRSQGVEPEAIARGVRAALKFDATGDPSAQVLQRAIREEGLSKALLRLCGVDLADWPDVAVWACPKDVP